MAKGAYEAALRYAARRAKSTGGRVALLRIIPPRGVRVDDTMVNGHGTIHGGYLFLLADAGYRHYELSSWARPGHEARHNAAYWARGIREPVRFASAVNALADFGVDVWLELNAQPALAHSTQECLTTRGIKVPVISSVRRDREFESMLEAAMDLHRAGVPLDFSAMTPSRHLLSLPAYAWEKARWWNEASDARDGRLAPGTFCQVRWPIRRSAPSFGTRRPSMRRWSWPSGLAA